MAHKTPAEIRDSADILFTTKRESGRNKHEGHMGMECSESKSYPAGKAALRGRLLLGHQGTGDPLGPMAGAPGSLAACSQEASWVFRALGQTCAARLTSNADGTVRTMQSQQALQTCPATSRRSSRTKGVKGYWGFINGCMALSSTGGRIHSHHPHNQLSMHSRPWLT